jgi:hypothetical protein
MEENRKNQNNDELSGSIDSEKDKESMETFATEISMPDVDDIPGQEGFVPAPLGDLADTTISSADEEGEEIFNDNLDEDITDDPDSNVSQTEKDVLAATEHDMPGDDENLRQAALDHTDEDGTPLNEDSFMTNVSGSDLDVPGAELDDENEEIGEEDEENNDYSLGSGGLGGDNADVPEDHF